MSLSWKRRRKQDRDKDGKEAKDINEGNNEDVDEDVDKDVNEDVDEDVYEEVNEEVIEDVNEDFDKDFDEDTNKDVVDEAANENVNENEYMKVEGRKKVRSWIPKSIHHWYPQPPWTPWWSCCLVVLFKW